jgi:hypothetical protein
MLHRKDIISHWARVLKATKYLELGLHNPAEVFDHIPCKHKFSVDINDEFATYVMSTDNFFNNLKKGKLNLDKDYKWDVIFIDANHLGNYVKNDLFNSLNHLSEDGIIFLHDVLPPNYKMQLEYGGCQTAWKVIPYILKYHPELHICTTDEVVGGLGFVFKNKSGKRKVLSENYNVFYEYYIMDKDRETSQNYIKNGKVEEWISNPYYNFSEEVIKHKENMYKTNFS